jgi:hypothetical protein
MPLCSLYFLKLFFFNICKLIALIWLILANNLRCK